MGRYWEKEKSTIDMQRHKNERESLQDRYTNISDLIKPSALLPSQASLLFCSYVELELHITNPDKRQFVCLEESWQTMT